MEIKSQHLSGASVLKLEKQKQPACNVTTSTPQLMHSVRFAGNVTAQQVAEVKKAAAQVGIGSKNEVVMPRFFMGSLPLDDLSAIESELPPDQQERMTSYIDLLKIALRENDNNPALLDMLQKPSPAIETWMKELHLTTADLEKPILNSHKIDQNNSIPPAVHQRMSKLGMYRLKIPTTYGGMGLNQRAYSMLLSNLPNVCGSNALATVVSAHSTIGSAPLLMFGTPEQQKKYLPAIAKGEYLAAFGLTEPLAGTDLNKLSTTAELSADGKHWKLNGEKIFITNTIDAGVAYFVAGKTIVNGEVQGPTVFIVDLPFRINQSKAQKKALLHEWAQKGLRITPFAWSDQKDKSLEMLMIRGSAQALIQFKDFEVPVADKNGISSILGHQGNGKAVPLKSLNKGRAGFGPLAASSATQLANEATAWAADRIMFDMYGKTPGQPGKAAHMEYLQKMHGQMHVDAAMSTAASELVSGIIDAYPDHGVAGLSAFIKVMTADYNWRNSVNRLETSGGHALIKGAPNKAERSFRDAWILRIVEGVQPAMDQLLILMGTTPLQELLGAGIKELAKRAKHLPVNIGTEMTLLAKGDFQKAKQHHQETSLFTVPEINTLAKAQMGKHDKGIIPTEEAAWIQSRVRRFSRRFGSFGVIMQERGAQYQNEMIRAARIVHDLFAITAANIKLAKKGEVLTPKEIGDLKDGIALAKRRVDHQMQFVGIELSFKPVTSAVKQLAKNPTKLPKKTDDFFLPKRDPEDVILVNAGNRALEEYEASEHVNRMDEHMAFLHRRADEFHAQLAKQYGQQQGA
jgi:butyryl-CoA dehydrogenase